MENFLLRFCTNSHITRPPSKSTTASESMNLQWINCIQNGDKNYTICHVSGGVMVFFVGNGYGDQSSNLGRSCSHFT